MPVPVPELGSYNFVPETKENLDWADLITVDLSLYNTPEGKKQLAQTLIKAVREDGFFYVKNFNISQDRVNRQFAIGKRFYDLPLEEKLKYVPEGLDNGKFNGYVPAGRRVLDPVSGLKDRVEIYNIPKFNGDFEQNHPSIVADNLPEIEEFARSLHSEVLDPLHVLLATALELPEDYFLNIHKYDVKSEDHLRYMKYSKYTPEENKKIGKLWVQGHTDLGSWTLLFRQPVAALQIQNHQTGEWKYVKPLDATLTVNACDALSFLTAGYVKSTIHRVTSPPKDQEHVDRLGLLYFSRPHNDVVLKTVESPVLQREGYTQNSFEKDGNPVPTMEEWTFAKQKWQRTKNAVRGDPKYENAQILPGHNEKFYA
ncbi:Clavaminate synthase-like protein [Irpex rosettiformis]|uniref:Clavaminate synthase-like protein n=1 Tax=Irpex rosettiformis TaxID=378272 RepID=A0ACB8U9B9_9APHY|nr:Clavaminate synthase-like protein [Irpex rosettiformis]